MELAGAIIAVCGSVFLFLAALGLLRMPDVYNRMQTGTKATTLGTLLVLAGLAVAQPGWAGKLLLVILFLVFTNPISSHALARAAHSSGIPLAAVSVKDDLKDDDDDN